MSETTVFAELVATTGIQPEGETSEFLRNLVKAVNDLPDATWEGLSPDAQTWFNEAAQVIQAEEGDIPLVPGMEEATAVAEEDAPEKAEPEKAEAAEEKPVKAKRQKAEKKEKKEKKPKREGLPVTSITRGVICENVDASLADVMKVLEERGVSIAKSSAQVVYLNFHKTLEAIKSSDGVKDKDGNVVVKYVA